MRQGEIVIPGNPAHTALKPFLSKPRFFPVGLWVVCFAAFAMIDDLIIHIFLLNRPEFVFAMFIQNLLKILNFNLIVKC